MAKIKKSQKQIKTVSPKTEPNSIPNWAVPFMLILTFIAYIPALKAGLVNWDDQEYVLNNLLIRDFSNFKALFTTPVQGNYHPLTMLSLAINYKISGLEAWSYHLFNILFHLANCFLVFKLVRILSNQNLIISFTTAILFAIHPMHVESVAWVSERKDVLNTLFFLLGLISYIKYIDTNSKKDFWLCFLYMILSLLSKPAAIAFPLALFSFDILRKRTLNIKLITEKLPFFVPVIVVAYLTLTAQTDAGATGSGIFPLTSRILFACYGIMMYLIKVFVPINLVPFYPFPEINKSFPIEYYLSPVIVLGLAFLFFYSLKKYREVAFGIFFFIINLILILQLIPVGSAVMADRYTYVPYIGLFYIFGWYIDRYSSGKYQKAFLIILPVSIVLSFLTYRQSGIWKDSASLWDHTIEVSPGSKAYSIRAGLYRKENKLEKALENYNKAISISIDDDLNYLNRGNIHLDLKNYDLALNDYRSVLSKKPNFYLIYDNIGTLYAITGKYDSALYYLNKSILIKPDYTNSYKNRALTFIQLNRMDDAIADFKQYLTLSPNSSDIINMIGDCLRTQNKMDEALIQIDKAISIKPDPIYYLNRSFVYAAKGNIEQAKKDALVAKQGGVQIDREYAKNIGLD